MKKIILLTSLLSLGLASCGNDDNTVLENETVETKLLGKWNAVKAEMYLNGKLEDSENLAAVKCENSYYEIKAGGTKDEVYFDEEGNCERENYPGTWTYNTSNKHITIVDSDDNYTMIYELVSVTNSDLKIKLIEDDGLTPDEGQEVFYYFKK